MTITTTDRAATLVDNLADDETGYRRYMMMNKAAHWESVVELISEAG